jgi:5-methylcytosine-specific restriction endonuclease McrA
MKLTKAQREQVRGMFGGRCAYCGLPLSEKWHADHVEPVVRKLEFVREAGKPTTMRATGEVWWPERDHIGNIMPACVPCNIRKGGEDLESFRRGMERSIQVMRDNYSAYRHALRFGLVEEKPAKVVFYFERFAQPQAEAA